MKDRYKVLNSNLSVVWSNLKLENAITKVLAYSANEPYYIQDNNGDFVYLAYGGAVWKPAEEFENA